MIEIEIEYELPRAALFRGLSHYNSKVGMMIAKRQITEKRHEAALLLKASGQLDALKALCDKAVAEKRKITMKSWYSRGKGGRAFDHDNALSIINKTVIDMLVEAEFLPGDQPKWLRQEIPEYIGNEAQPRLILQFKLGD